MVDFAITSPKLGMDESIPKILLDEAFISRGSENVHERFGEYHALRGRLFEIIDATGNEIAIPTDVFVISSIVTGTKTINITGDHSAGNTPLVVGATIRINGHANSANNKKYTVASLPTTSSIVTSNAITSGTTSGNVFVGATPAIKIHRHIRQTNGAEFLLLGTIYNVFSWGFTNKTLTVKFTSGTPASVERMEIITHLDDIYMTNNVDLIQKWAISTAPSASFADFQSASGVDVESAATFIIKAKHLASYESYLFIGYVIYNDNSVHPQTVHHSSRADTTDFDINSSGDAGRKIFNENPDFLKGFGKWSIFLIVFKDEHHVRGTLVEADEVFDWDNEELKVGAKSADAIINDRNGNLIWLASDFTIREINTSFELSENVDKTIKSINLEKEHLSQMTFIDELGSIYLSVPTSNSDENNTLIEFNPKTGASFIHNQSIRAFGDFTRQAQFTYDTLEFSNYPDWGASWLIYDSIANQIGFPLDLGSDYNGFVSSLRQAEKDNGVDFTRTLIFETSFQKGKSLNVKKRINNGLIFYFNRQGEGSVSVSIKVDGEANWQSLGSVSLTDSANPEYVRKHIPSDFEGFNTSIRMQSTDRMEFLALLALDFELTDER